jgi:hypothetical protein
MTHNWKIYDLKRTISEDVVTEVTYALQTEFSGSNARSISTTPVTGSIDDPDFIPFNDLTEEVVLSWVTGSIDVQSLETANSASIAKRIARKAARTTTNGTPW